MPIERILEAENLAENALSGSSTSTSATEDDFRMHMSFDSDVEGQNTKRKMLHQLVEWAKHIPRFTDLKIDDQVGLVGIILYRTIHTPIIIVTLLSNIILKIDEEII